MSPLNTFLRIGKDPDPYLWLTDPEPGGPKTYGASGSGTLVSSIFLELLSLFSLLLIAFLFSGSLKSISSQHTYYGPAAPPHIKKHRGEETKTRRHCGVWFGCPLRCALTLNRRHSQMIPKSRPAQPASLPTARHTGWTPLLGEQVIRDFEDRWSNFFS